MKLLLLLSVLLFSSLSFSGAKIETGVYLGLDYDLKLERNVPCKVVVAKVYSNGDILIKSSFDQLWQKARYQGQVLPISNGNDREYWKNDSGKNTIHAAYFNEHGKLTSYDRTHSTFGGAFNSSISCEIHEME